MLLTLALWLQVEAICAKLNTLAEARGAHALRRAAECLEAVGNTGEVDMTGLWILAARPRGSA